MTTLRIRVTFVDNGEKIYNSWDFLKKEIVVNIKGLNCDYNKLISLPDSLGNCTNLQYLDCSYNNIFLLPDLSKCQQLEILDCENNKLISLPKSLGNCTNLEELYCNNNNLISLPESLRKCTKLQYLWCDNNYISKMRYPEKLTSKFKLSKQYHVNYLVKRIQRAWKGYYYLQIMSDNYPYQIKKDIISFI